MLAGDFHRELAVRVVGAFALGMIPHPANDFAILGPVGLAGVGQGGVKRAVGEMDHRQAPAGLQILQQIFLGGVAQAGALPVDVVLNNQFVGTQVFAGEELDIIDDPATEPAIAFDDRLENLRGFPPVVKRPVMTGEDQGQRRRTDDHLAQFAIAGEFAANALGRYFRMGRPQDRVQQQLAVGFVSPVVEEMTAGEADAPTAVGPFQRPADRLRAFLGNLHIQDRRRLGGLGPEFQVVIELVANLERLDAPSGRMLSGGCPGHQCLDLGIPAVRGRAALVIKVAADPVEHGIAAGVVGHEGGPVNQRQSAAAIHLFFQDRESIADEQGMILRVAIRTAADEHDGVGVVQGRHAVRPASEMRLGPDVRHVARGVKAVLEQSDGFFVFVRAGGMAAVDRPGDQDDLFGSHRFRPEGEGGGNKQHKGEESSHFIDQVDFRGEPHGMPSGPKVPAKSAFQAVGERRDARGQERFESRKARPPTPPGISVKFRALRACWIEGGESRK